MKLKAWQRADGTRVQRAKVWLRQSGRYLISAALGFGDPPSVKPWGAVARPIPAWKNLRIKQRP